MRAPIVRTTNSFISPLGVIVETIAECMDIYGLCNVGGGSWKGEDTKCTRTNQNPVRGTQKGENWVILIAHQWRWPLRCGCVCVCVMCTFARMLLPVSTANGCKRPNAKYRRFSYIGIMPISKTTNHPAKQYLCANRIQLTELTISWNCIVRRHAMRSTKCEMRSLE